MGSFSAALSGLSANSTAIDVVGNNLANLNTPGFKEDTVTFQDLVTESIGAGLGATQVGFGVGTPITLRQFSQGALQSTGGPLDAAIQGDGFFIVSGRQREHRVHPRRKLQGEYRRQPHHGERRAWCKDGARPTAC